MLIESVRLKNIKSFSDAEIHFKAGVNFIKGANGTGKSTLIESIGFALFNVTTTGFSGGIHSYLLREGEREGEVCVRFRTNGQSYSVMRTVSQEASRRKWQIFCGEESVNGLLTDRDRMAFLQDAMGIPPEQRTDKLFTDMIGVKQGQFKAPFEDSQANRIRYFNEIFGVADFNRARDNMAAVKKIIQTKRTELQNLSAVLEGTIAQYEAKKEEYARLLSEQKKAEETFLLLSDQCRKAKEVYDLHRELETLTAQIDLVRQNGEKQMKQALLESLSLAGEFSRANAEENTVLSEMESHKTLQAAMDAVKEALEKIRRDASGVGEYLHGSVERIAYERENVIESLEEAKTEAAKLENGICPYFGEICDKMQGKQAISRTQPILEKLQETESRFSEALMRPRKMEWKKHIIAYSSAAKELCSFFEKYSLEDASAMVRFDAFCGTQGGVQALYDALVQWSEDIRRIKEGYSAHAAELQSALEAQNRELISRSAAAAQAADGIRRRQEDTEKKIENLRREMETAGIKEKRRDEIAAALGHDMESAAQAQNELMRLTGEVGRADEQRQSLKKMLESLERDIEEMDKTRLKMAEYEKRGAELSRAGSTAELLADLLRRAGGRVAELYTGRISAWAARMYAGVAEDGAQLRFDTEYDAKLVDIYKGNERSRSFNQLSGGQRMIAALCVRIAMLTSFAGLPIAFFDEPTENIDAEKKQNLAEILKKMLGDFTQIFIISHDDAFDRLTENVIYLEETREGTICGAL